MSNLLRCPECSQLIGDHFCCSVCDKELCWPTAIECGLEKCQDCFPEEVASLVRMLKEAKDLLDAQAVGSSLLSLRASELIGEIGEYVR